MHARNIEGDRCRHASRSGGPTAHDGAPAASTSLHHPWVVGGVEGHIRLQPTQAYLEGNQMGISAVTRVLAVCLLCIGLAMSTGCGGDNGSEEIVLVRDSTIQGNVAQVVAALQAPPGCSTLSPCRAVAVWPVAVRVPGR